jgi:hypothetical protein
MPERPVAAPAGAPVIARPGNAGSEPGGRLRTGWTTATRLLASRWLRWGFVALAVGLGGDAVARERADVQAALARLGFLAVVAAMLCVLIALIATMQVWRLLLAALGSPLPVRAAARIMFIGQLGKYLPGSIWPVLAQMELGTVYKVPRHRSASASVLTMVLSLLTGLLIALVTLPFVTGSMPYRWAFLAAPILLVCLHPKVLNRVLGRLLRLARQPALEQPLAGRAVAGALGWALTAWIFYGLQIWLLATRLGAPYGFGVLLATGGFAFAWCVGFLVIIAPAGAGVREVLLVGLLGPVLGVGGATAVALVSRALTTVGDLLTAAVAALCSRPSRVVMTKELRGDADGP